MGEQLLQSYSNIRYRRYTDKVMPRDRVILERRFVPKGHVIIKEGDEGYSAYLIQSGEVEVYSQNEEGQEVILARLGTGEICGEMALISDGIRTASVRTSQDCNLVIITRAAFDEKLKKTDTTIQAVVHMLIRRIVSSNKERLDQVEHVEDINEDNNKEETKNGDGKSSDVFWDF